jgi:chromosome segregation ATPase
MQEIDKRIGLLRLLLADVDGRIQQQQEISGQYRVQIARIVDAVVRQAGDVGQALTAMAEVEERLAQIESTGRHLVQVRQRAARELEALLLTKRVAEAQAQLEELEGRRQELATQLAALSGNEPVAPATQAPDTPDLAEAAALRVLNEQVSSEIDRLHRLISEASQRAARSISSGV